jgi:hypothetical protein
MKNETKEEIKMWVFGGGFIIIGLVIWASALLIGPKYQYFSPELSAKFISLTAYIILILIGGACEFIGLPTVLMLFQKRKRSRD